MSLLKERAYLQSNLLSFLLPNLWHNQSMEVSENSHRQEPQLHTDGVTNLSVHEHAGKLVQDIASLSDSEQEGTKDKNNYLKQKELFSDLF